MQVHFIAFEIAINHSMVGGAVGEGEKSKEREKGVFCFSLTLL